MVRFDMGQTVRVIDADSPYCNCTGIVRQIVGLDFGISDMIDKYIVVFPDWPKDKSPTAEFIERQLEDAPASVE
ncbi:MAG: hypothetical protein HN929_01150 [Chloroflexi bacterium]|jgi:hypothetical protein|nr:hypothetical protein [Chloroflexota bacterium]MBT7080071.1 hypothetical protein [Chloroflexota bacterium]MBT7289766.1 hypothetical protein [Chloroflexota bacterium]